MRRGGLLIAIALFSFSTLGSNLAFAADAAGFQWQEPEGDHVDLTFDGHPALRYMMPTLDESSDEKRSETFKPYHHIYSPDGKTLLTKGSGGLYPHHRGLFYGFNKITYGDGMQCDTWHCKEKTHQAHEKILKQQAGPHGGWHRVAIEWRGREGELFAHETRTVNIRRKQVDGVDGWQVTFTAKLETADGKPIHLDGDPQHAGVQFRSSQEVPDKTAKETYYLRPDGKGKPGEFRNWDEKAGDSPANKQSENLPWNALSMVIGGQRYTVVYLDSPNNPKPSRYSERDYGRFGSYFVADVTKDKPLKVKYRFWIQPGEMTVEQCNKLYEEFVAQSKAKPTTASR